VKSADGTEATLEYTLIQSAELSNSSVLSAADDRIKDLVNNNNLSFS
jgi:hypothetical protein